MCVCLKYVVLIFTISSALQMCVWNVRYDEDAKKLNTTLQSGQSIVMYGLTDNDSSLQLLACLCFISEEVQYELWF